MTRKAKARAVSQSWGLSSARATAPIKTIITDRNSDGPGPATHMKRPARRAPPNLARTGPKSGRSAAIARTARTDRCSPDRARMCEQPAALKASASSGARLSRTPRISACISPAERLPIRASACLKAPRRPLLTRSTRPPLSISRISRGCANSAPPEENEPRALIREPESTSGPRRARTRRSSPRPRSGKDVSTETPSPTKPRRSTLIRYERKPFLAGLESVESRPSAQIGRRDMGSRAGPGLGRPPASAWAMAAPATRPSAKATACMHRRFEAPCPKPRRTDPKEANPAAITTAGSRKAGPG